mmetsp:Transcript_10944/g.9431  ORF Transcript_10944/g.9431 Transcript_10944/m.9431 type:complete len:370 (-) Transcript_10944:162-1271(-)
MTFQRNSLLYSPDFFSIFRGYILSVTNIWLLISALLHILSPNILVRFIPLHSIVLLLLVIVLLRGWHLILLLLLIAILLLLLLLVIHWLAIGVRLIVGLSKLILWIRGLLVSKALLSFSFNSGIHIAVWILNWGSTTTSIVSKKVTSTSKITTFRTHSSFKVNLLTFSILLFFHLCLQKISIISLLHFILELLHLCIILEVASIILLLLLLKIIILLRLAHIIASSLILLALLFFLHLLLQKICIILLPFLLFHLLHHLRIRTRGLCAWLKGRIEVQRFLIFLILKRVILIGIEIVHASGLALIPICVIVKSSIHAHVLSIYVVLIGSMVLKRHFIGLMILLRLKILRLLLGCSKVLGVFVAHKHGILF